MKGFLLALIVSVASSVSAAPTWRARRQEITPSASASAAATSATSPADASGGCASPAGDAPFSQSCDDLNADLTCPTGITGAAGGIVLLVHGTASTGPETWADGPYVQTLPALSPGFDVCYISIPGRSLRDAQLNAEYVAYNIQQLAPQSSTGKVSVVAHSQGAGLNTQWALTYFRSTRSLVTTFVSLSGDFEGTAEGPFLCAAQNVTEGGCAPGIIQQDVGSVYLAAQAHQGGTALVPTTSLRTIEDEIIQPQVGPNPTSQLSNAVNLPLQDPSVCGVSHVADHFSMTVDTAAFGLAYDALSHGGTADVSRFNSSSCTTLPGPNPTLSRADDVPGLLRQAAFDAIAVLADIPRVKVEPPLAAYVCSGQFGIPASCSQPPLAPAGLEAAAPSASSSGDVSSAASSQASVASSAITDQLASSDVIAPTTSVSVDESPVVPTPAPTATSSPAEGDVAAPAPTPAVAGGTPTPDDAIPVGNDDPTMPISPEDIGVQVVTVTM